MDRNGRSHPLHSLVDPVREAGRLISSLGDEGFIVLLGLGGGYTSRTALERAGTEAVLVIDFDAQALGELLCSIDYRDIFLDPRFHLLIDPGPSDIEETLLSLYQPVLAGGIRALPLRGRVDMAAEAFGEAAGAIQRAIERVSADYSVQAHFGRRWFSNILRNIRSAGPVEPLRRQPLAAVTAAGPSLDGQMPLLRKRREGLFLIATDTSLPVLLSGGISPDAVVSIDPQHISYLHFMAGFPPGTLLFLDLAAQSPSWTARSAQDSRLHFFSGGHPLSRYVSLTWRPFPELDASGGNVTYAAISLAEEMGARIIDLYGVDFSYPQGRMYARGTYLFPLFDSRQNRLSPPEAQWSSLLYRTSLEKKDRAGSWYYEPPLLRAYRERLEGKAVSLEPELRVIPGLGSPIRIERKPPEKRGQGTTPQTRRIQGSPGNGNTQEHRGSSGIEAGDFLAHYRENILTLPRGKRSAEGGPVFLSLLPLAASIKRNHPEMKTEELLEFVKTWAGAEIERVLNGR